MTLMEAFAAGRALTMEIQGDPESVRRITLLREDGGEILAFDGQEADPWSVRHPVVLIGVRGDGPVWTAGHMIIRDVTPD